MSAPVSVAAQPAWGLRFGDQPANPGELQTLPLPHSVCVPLQQHTGTEALPVVQPGEHVLTGQPIAEIRDRALGAKLHAPVSGTVTQICRSAVPGRKDCQSIYIESDGRDKRWPGYSGHTNPLRLATTELRQAVIEGGVVGLGGATFPAGVKLNPGSGVDTLILNGAECEPVISCDEALMTNDSAQMLLGAEIMLRILEADKCIIAIKQGMESSLRAVNAALDKLQDDRFRIVLVPPVYPVGGEAQLIQMLTGREIPAGGLPWDSGAICQNVATAAAVAHRLTAGEPLISRIVTVTGQGVRKPGNFLTRIGTPISELIAAAGGYSEMTPGSLVMGGPMMGIRLPNDSLPVTKACNCIYVPGANELTDKPAEMPCIRCGDCTDTCPVNLMPQLLAQTLKVSDYERLGQLGIQDCIECGCCDYVCPSHIPLTRQFIDAKQTLWEIAFEKRRAKKAARRIREREIRQQRDTSQREQLFEDQLQAVAESEAAKQELKALLKRVNQSADRSADPPSDDS